MVTKQLDIKNRIYYFHSDLINIKDADERLLKINKKSQWVLAFITLVTSQKNLSIKLINGNKTIRY